MVERFESKWRTVCQDTAKRERLKFNPNPTQTIMVVSSSVLFVLKELAMYFVGQRDRNVYEVLIYIITS